MHTCPFCGKECDCDMDDTSNLPIPYDCPHICEPDDWEDQLDQFFPEDERLDNATEGGEE